MRAGYKIHLVAFAINTKNFAVNMLPVDELLKLAKLIPHETVTR